MTTSGPTDGGSLRTPASAVGLLVSATLLQSAPNQVAPLVRSAAFVTASTGERRGYRWAARESSDAR